jgi:hypothetical protein
MKLINLPALLPALLLGACSQLPGPTMKSHNLSGSHIYSSGPSLSSFVVQDRNNPRKICADRGADAAFEFSEEGNFSLSLVSVGKSDGDKSSAKENSGEEEMVGRTPAVLIARELLYRTCELSMNYSLTKEEAISLFKGTRDSIEKGWVSEAAKTTITIGDTLTQLVLREALRQPRLHRMPALVLREALRQPRLHRMPAAATAPPMMDKLRRPIKTSKNNQ